MEITNSIQQPIPSQLEQPEKESYFLLIIINLLLLPVSSSLWIYASHVIGLGLEVILLYLVGYILIFIHIMLAVGIYSILTKKQGRKAIDLGIVIAVSTVFASLGVLWLYGVNSIHLIKREAENKNLTLAPKFIQENLSKDSYTVGNAGFDQELPLGFTYSYNIALTNPTRKIYNKLTIITTLQLATPTSHEKQKIGMGTSHIISLTPGQNNIKGDEHFSLAGQKYFSGHKDELFELINAGKLKDPKVYMDIQVYNDRFQIDKEFIITSQINWKNVFNDPEVLTAAEKLAEQTKDSSIKTYTNTGLHFSFTYPSNGFVHPYSNKGDDLSKPYLSISDVDGADVQLPYPYLSLRVYWRNYPTYDFCPPPYKKIDVPEDIVKDPLYSSNKETIEKTYTELAKKGIRIFTCYNPSFSQSESNLLKVLASFKNI